MKGMLIFKHAMSMVLRNWREAVQIGLVPMFILFGFLVAIVGPEIFGFVQHVDPFGTEEVPSNALLAPIFWVFGAIILCAIWVFVGWHRFILLGIYPKGWIPRPYLRAVLAYLARIFMLLLIGCFLLVLLTILSAALLTMPGTGNMVIFGFYAIILIVFTRLSPILPAAAIGKNLKLVQALAATKGANVDFLIVIGLCASVVVALALGVGLVERLVGGISVLLLIPANLFLTLLAVSIVTTIYGHYVEKRPLT
ncbi:hypothetical protein C8N36_12146 [Pelagimonas varians]|uniref:DUF4013 domain-containing protein n=2 Tax=Pelagimonas varians TaxID=696760 RepID=A0A238L314_9RHOB|nr:hypothetical protein [Pelagimonas varians]PYG26569.1 hypothetical protein C8N36_12146 [Pelagimonas varians]SMX49409.1 hypothetical protein PEV8663_04207 [Pelagimonas varians]